MEVEENEAQVQAYEKLYKAGQYAQLLRDTDPPQTPEQCYFRGLGFQEIKQFDESLDCFKKVYPYRSLFPDLEYNLGLAYFYKEDYASSVKHFENFRRVHRSSSSIYHEEVMVLYLSRRWQDVCELCDQALEWQVKRLPTRFWALAQLQLGQVQLAHTKLIQALEADWENAGLWDALGDVLLVAGHPVEATQAHSVAQQKGARDLKKVESPPPSSTVLDLGPQLLPRDPSGLEKPRHSMCEVSACAVF